MSRAALPYDVTYSTAEFESLRLGLIPQGMDDYWFIFYEEPWLYFHRSWSGVCVYGLRLDRIGESCHVAEAWVNRDPEQDRRHPADYALATLRVLLHALLHRGHDPPKELFEDWRRTLPPRAVSTAPSRAWWHRLFNCLRPR